MSDVSLNINYCFYRSKYGSGHISVYCKYWVINKTGDELILRDACDHDLLFSISSSPLEVKTLSQTILSDEPLCLPSLISVSDASTDDAIVLSIHGNYGWSDPFSIKTLGMNGQCTLRSTDSEHEHLLAVSITRAPGVFARSLVVTFTPLFIVINQMNIPIKIKQVNSLEKCGLQPGAFTSYHWTSYKEAHQLCVYLDRMPYDWSQPISLLPGHYCLQLLSKYTDSSNHNAFATTGVADPSQEVNSVVQVDVTIMKAQIYVFVKNVTLQFMPFCISNNCVINRIVIRQKSTSWNAALHLMPLTSQMWTLPSLLESQDIEVFCQCVGSKQNSNTYIPVLSVNLKVPGYLGEWKDVKSNHTITLEMRMERSTRVLVFQERRRKEKGNDVDEYQHSDVYITGRMSLLSRRDVIDSDLSLVHNTITEYFSSRSSSSLGVSTCIFFRYIFDTDLHGVGNKPLRIDMHIGEKLFSLQTTGGSIGVLKGAVVLNNQQKLLIRLFYNNDGDMTEPIGIGSLDINAFNELEHIYDISVPFHSEKDCLMGYIAVSIFNTQFGDIARDTFTKAELCSLLDSIQTTLTRINNENRVEKSLLKASSLEISSRHLMRATSSGFYRTPSSVTPRGDSESGSVSSPISRERALTESDVYEHMNFVISIHSLLRLEVPESLQNIYATVRVGDTEMRTPVTNTFIPDTELWSLPTVDICTRGRDFGCEMAVKNDKVVITQILRTSLAYNQGVRVGHILYSINNTPTPHVLRDISHLLNNDMKEKHLIFIPPPICNLYQLVFEQNVIVSAEHIRDNTVFFICFYQEHTSTEDVLIVSKCFPLIRDTDMDFSTSLENDLCLTLETSWHRYDLEEDLMQTAVTVNMMGIGVSIVTAAMREIAYISVNKIWGEFRIFEIGKKLLEMKVNSVQIDNQIMETKYPVIFGSPIDINTMNWLHLSAIILPHPSVLYIEYFGLLVQEMRLCIESSLVMEFISFIKDIPLQLFTETDKNCMIKLNEYAEFVRPLMIPDFMLNTASLFAEMFQMQPALISVTIITDPKCPLTGSSLPNIPLLVPLQAILDTASTVVGNVDNAQIRLKSFITDNLFITKTDLLQRLLVHYKKQALGQIYKILGSVTFLGNPAGLLENLGSGVKAFFFEPINGLVKGPEEFVDGLGKGTKHLLLRTTYGILNSAGKITETIGDGLSSLTMNGDYKCDRAAGKRGFFYGLKDGISGVVLDPMRGARENGFIGALAGTSRGLVGLIVKPVTGVVDETTRLFENVKNATKIEKRINRIRYPRYVHIDNVLTPYCQHLANGKFVFSRCLNSMRLNVSDKYIVHVLDSERNYLMITLQCVALVNSAYHVHWVMYYNNIGSVFNEYNILRFNVDAITRVVVLQSEIIASRICILIAAFRNDEEIDVTPYVKQITSFYGETLSEDDIILCNDLTREYDWRKSDGEKEKANLGFDLKGIIPNSAVIIDKHLRFETIKNTKLTRNFEEFEIKVNCDKQSLSWIIFRRFNDLTYIHKCMLKEKGRGCLSGMKLPPLQFDVLKNLNIKMNDNRIDQINSYLRILMTNNDLLRMPCVDNFLKADYISMSKD